MSRINIKFMKDNMLETLKANINAVTQYLIDHPDDTAWLDSLKPEEAIFEDKKYYIEDFELDTPQNADDKSTDIKNSIVLYEHLKGLPLYVLSDAHFWNWLNFTKGYKAALKLMPIQKESSVFKDHWLFSNGNRRSLMFGVLSRCFYRVALTVDETLKDKYELSRFVIEKPIRFRNLSWRTFSSEKKIVLGTLKAEKAILSEYGEIESTKYFEKLAKDISKFGSCMLLDVMSENDIYNYVYKKYTEMLIKDGKKRATEVDQSPSTVVSNREKSAFIENAQGESENTIDTQQGMSKEDDIEKTATQEVRNIQSKELENDNSESLKLLLHMPKNKLDSIKELFKYLRLNNIIYIDKRSKGGALWIIGGQELSNLLAMYPSLKFHFKENGGNVTKNKAAWWSK